MFDPGQLVEQITIQEQTGARGAYGQLAETWTTLSGGSGVWAKIEPLSGREALLAASNEATTTHRITMRALAGVTPRMRAAWGSRVLNFVSGRPIATDGHYMTIDAVEVA